MRCGWFKVRVVVYFANFVHRGLRLATLRAAVLLCLAIVIQTAAAHATMITVSVPSTGKRFSFDANFADTGGALSQQLEPLTSIPANRQQLVFAGQIVTDSRTLADLRAFAGATLFVLVKVGSDGPGDPPILVPGDSPKLVLSARGLASAAAATGRAINHAAQNRIANRIGSIPDSSATVMTMGTIRRGNPSAIWIDGGLTTLFGAVAGEADSIVLGVDTLTSKTGLIGLYLAFANAEVDMLLRGKSTTLGLYGATTLADGWLLTANFGIADTGYTFADTSVSGRRILAALSVTRSVQTTNARFETALSVSGFDEKINQRIGPAFTLMGDHIQQANGEITVSAIASRPVWESPFAPYASLSLGHVTTRSEQSGTESDTTASLGLGLSGQVGSGIAIIGATVAALGQGVTSSNLSLAYTLEF